MADLHTCREIEIMPELPPDILFFHILPRLPAKSVLRFRCVCKQWQSFLKTPTFSDLHRRHHDQNHQILLYLSTTPPYTLRTFDCEAPEDGLSAPRSLPFEAKPGYIKIIASLNGLVCVGIKLNDTEYSDFILWNPLTGEYKRLSRTNSDKECYMCSRTAFGLYYINCCSEYKLLCVCVTTDFFGVYIYSLKSDSWRKMDDHNIQRIPYGFVEFWEASVVLNEKLYFLKRVKSLATPSSYSIITFDMKTEKFSEIATPSLDLRRSLWLNMMVVRGCIHLFDSYWTGNKNCVIEMWRMDGEGDWRQVKTYFETPSFPWFPWFRIPLHVMNNGNWLLSCIAKGYVYKVDLETHTIQYLFPIIHIRRIPFSGKYIETFVSLY